MSLQLDNVTKVDGFIFNSKILPTTKLSMAVDQHVIQLYRS